MQRPSYGDVTAEYLALRSGCGLVEHGHDLVWVEGPDTLRFLDGLLSRAIERLDEGAVGRSLLLGPQGKLRATLHVLRGGDRVGLVADAGRGEVVAADLARFKIRVDAEISTEERDVVALWGPDAGLVAGAAGLAMPAPGRWTDDAKALVAWAPFTRAGLGRVLVAGLAADELVAAGARRVGSDAVNAVRVELGEPVVGIDLDERTIPQEGLVVDGAVDFDKGCYLGQELVARIDSRGRVNRLLRGVVVGTNVVPPPRARVMADGTDVGEITSVGESLELRAPVALGLLRREIQPGAPVTVVWEGGTTRAEVRDLPLDPGLAALR